MKQPLEVSAVRQEHGVGHSIGEAADRDSCDVPTPGTSETDVPWSVEGLQAAQKADKDIVTIIQLLQKSTEKPAWEEIGLASSDVITLWIQWPRWLFRTKCERCV